MSGSWLRNRFVGLSLVAVIAAAPAHAADEEGAGTPTSESEQGADTASSKDTAGTRSDDVRQTDVRAGYQPGSGDLFKHVASLAKERAESEYTEPEKALPEALTAMDYSQYRGIRFRQEAALWADHSPFHVEFFHPGFLYDAPVTIHAVSDDGVRAMRFRRSAFEYSNGVEGLDRVAEASSEMDPAAGYAGFRVHYPINDAGTADEVMVFLGASYFRMVGPDQSYGLSARGLAVDTAEPQGEEFPAFREFWLVRPEAEATQLRVYALLDSPSVTGAYRFDLQPGSEMRVDVKSRLFARNEVGKLGIAPLTSMFLYGENRTRYYDDFRPEVHDSDGLAVHSDSGRWLWRPLTNPGSLRVTSHQGATPRGFGLAQRDRDFQHYLDQQARYDRRPSLWVTPEGGDWGQGRVELVEIPSDSETNDNIVTYWVPKEPMSAGESRRYDYRLATFGSLPPGHDTAWVTRTRIGWGAVPGMADPPPRSKRQFIVDFEGPSLARLGDDLPVEPVLETSSGKVQDLSASPLPGNDAWRVSFKLSPEDERPADMRLHLALRGERLTETWNYVWSDDAR